MRVDSLFTATRDVSFDLENIFIVCIYVAHLSFIKTYALILKQLKLQIKMTKKMITLKVISFFSTPVYSNIRYMRFKS